VIALEGDGSLLMNLGCLATIAALAPPNLTVIVWVNGAYQITGNQPAATAEVTDVVAVARGAGIESSAWVGDEADFVRRIERALQSPGPHFLAARIDQAPGTGRPERDPVVLKDRFMRGIGAK
jgi:thiamine pyrophosphate-dependent acetolactate synthase large subunit-like protein